jgi:hypothetical protein
MAKKKQRRIQCSSLIVVGEGPHDKAFISHMKSLYDTRNTGQTVKVESATGGSPITIVKSALKNKHADYDRKYVLMDSDVEISQKCLSYAKQNKVTIILSTPVCLEGMLLEVLGRRVAEGTTNSECKRRLHPELSGEPTCKDSYSTLFTLSVLNETKKVTIVNLRELLSNKK